MNPQVEAISLPVTPHAQIEENMQRKVEWGLLSALWRRDLMRFRKEKSRWIGVVAQPLLFWVFIGLGMTESFQLNQTSEVTYLEFFFPGTLVMCILFTSIFASMSLIEDKQTGFVRLALAAPGSYLSLVAGKVLGVTTIALIQASLYLAFAPLAGFSLLSIAWHQLVPTLILGCIGLSAINITMAWVLNSTHAYHGIMSVLLIPLWILSGSMFPIKAEKFQVLFFLNPMASLTENVRMSLGGKTTQLAAHSFSQNIVFLTAFALVGLATATYVIRRTKNKGAA
jgi:ABC-2 type transport system permease protein